MMERTILAGALRARVRGGAADDVLRRAAERFTEEPTAEAVDTWLETELRPSAPHLFVPSTGGGAAGGSRPGLKGFDPNGTKLPADAMALLLEEDRAKAKDLCKAARKDYDFRSRMAHGDWKPDEEALARMLEIESWVQGRAVEDPHGYGFGEDLLGEGPRGVPGRPVFRAQAHLYL